MLDRFLFRAWDESNKNMEYIDDLFWFEEHGVHDGSGNGDNGKYVLMRCTDLRDKNSKLVYDGDIFQLEDRLVYVYWLDKNAQFDSKFIKDYGDIRIENFKGFAPRDFQYYPVIGNIHENPELLIL